MLNPEDYSFRTPSDLTKTSAGLKKILIVGSCTVSLTSGFWDQLFGVKTEFVHILSLAQMEGLDPSEFDFQLTSIPLNFVMHFNTYWNSPYQDQDAAQIRFEQSASEVRRILDSAFTFTRASGLPTFVSNFLVPQQNPLGRMLPRYDLRNPVYYVEKLNEIIDQQVRTQKGAYLLDADSVASTHGKRFFQDDSIWNLSHGGVVTDLDYTVLENRRNSSNLRLEPIRSAIEELDLNPAAFWGALVQEAHSMYRIIKQTDAVKIVIVDLDDTLWRGVIAEESTLDHEFHFEGLHFGFIEALSFLKKRGVLLAIASKNELAKIVRLWPRLFGPEFPIENFFTMKINWGSKSENIEEILREANLLSRNAVFIDDNPREREEVMQAFPDIRVLGSDPYGIRKALLWGSETQVSFISEESSRRTEMVQQQIVRESEKRGKTREEFLADQNIRMRAIEITSIDDPAFMRSLELMNKTNQFNTTGVRWSDAQVHSLFSEGGKIFAFDVEDRFSKYGIVISALVHANQVKIFTMSCRVIGFDAELGALGYICKDIEKSGHQAAIGVAVDTDANLLSRDLFVRSGFAKDGDIWVRNLSDEILLPQHIVYS